MRTGQIGNFAIKAVLISTLTSVDVAGIASAAACPVGHTLKVEGTVDRIFFNQAKTWSIVIGNLKDKTLSGCDFENGTGGEKTASGIWIMIALQEKPQSCQVGSKAIGTIEVTDGLFGPDFDSKALVCPDSNLPSAE
jgi:hypothetical protein